MSSSAPKSAPEVLPPLEIDQLLSAQLHQEQLQRRHRKIARISRLWDQRKLLAKITAGGAIAAMVIAFLIPVEYTATTRLMPPDPSGGQGMALLAGLAGRIGAMGAIGSELLGITASGELFAGVLQSTTVQNELIAKYDLRRVYGEKRLIDTRKELTRETDISIDHKSGIITIKVTDHDPKRASALAQEYIAELNDVVTQLNTSSAHRERVFLEERLGQVKSELESAEEDFSQFSSKNAALDIKEQGKAMVESAAILEGQLIAAQTELQGLRQIFTDQNIRVQTTQARIAELRRQIQKLGGTPNSVAQPTKEDELYPSIRKLPLLGVTYADLYRRMKVEETVFETLTQQYEVAKVQEAKEVPSVKVLDPPEVPEKKTFPPRTLLTLLGAVLAFIIGAGWLTAKDHWATIDPQDPGKILVLNMVQSVRPQLNYIVQTRNSVTEQAKKSLERLRGGSEPLETRQ
jgi:capsule polysaccharide export protein KpsE/RkpR